MGAETKGTVHVQVASSKKEGEAAVRMVLYSDDVDYDDSDRRITFIAFEGQFRSTCDALIYRSRYFNYSYGRLESLDGTFIQHIDNEW